MSVRVLSPPNADALLALALATSRAPSQTAQTPSSLGRPSATMLRSTMRACRLPLPSLVRLPLQPPLRCQAPVSAGRFFASTPSDEKPTPPEEKPSRWQRIKSMFKEHGPVFVAYYVTTWTAGAAVCYGGITIAGIRSDSTICSESSGPGTPCSPCDEAKDSITPYRTHRRRDLDLHK